MFGRKKGAHRTPLASGCLTRALQRPEPTDTLRRPVGASIEVLVPTARLELAQLSPLPPQDSVSTNSTTSARRHCDPQTTRFAGQSRSPDSPEF
jgi:hypothetical protein